MPDATGSTPRARMLAAHSRATTERHTPFGTLFASYEAAAGGQRSEPAGVLRARVRLRQPRAALLFSARGRHADAARAFRRATLGPAAPTAVLDRIHFEHASSLLALGRASQAVRSLEFALAGPIEGSYYHLSRSDVHALLAEAFEAAGQLDARSSIIARPCRLARRGRRVAYAAHTRRDSTRIRLSLLERLRRVRM